MSCCKVGNSAEIIALPQITVFTRDRSDGCVWEITLPLPSWAVAVIKEGWGFKFTNISSMHEEFQEWRYSSQSRRHDQLFFHRQGDWDTHGVTQRLEPRFIFQQVWVWRIMIWHDWPLMGFFPGCRETVCQRNHWTWTLQTWFRNWDLGLLSLCFFSGTNLQVFVTSIVRGLD